jgi:hypothetical protein
MIVGADMKCVAVMPSPMMSESQIAIRIEENRRALWTRGYWILGERRIHNPVFDGRGQRTTVAFEYRPCISEEEAEEIARKILEIAKECCSGGSTGKMVKG